mgnify:FL=1
MRNEKGFTLTEVLVSFMLLGILMASVTMVLSAFTRVYTRMKAVTNMEMMADTILEDLNHEIKTSRNTSLKPIVIQNGGKELVYLDENDLEVTVYVKGQESKDTSGYNDYDKIGQGKVYYAYKMDAGYTCWALSDNTYMDNVVKGIRFEKMDAYNPKNVLKVTIQLEHEPSGATFDEFRYIEYRFHD